MPHRLRTNAAVMFERLEDRTLLAAYSGAIFADAPAEIEGGNDAHTILFTEWHRPSANAAPVQWARINNQWIAVADLPGFGSGTVIRGVNDAGDMYGEVVSSQSHDDFLVHAGVRTPLADAIQSWVGRTGDTTNIYIRALANDGAVLLQQDADTSDQQLWNWRLKDGVATLVGETFNTAMNNVGSIITIWGSGGDQSLLRKALYLEDGTEVLIPGMRANPVLSDDNSVAWLDAKNGNANVVVWKNGATTLIALPYLSDAPQQDGPLSWHLRDINTQGRVLMERAGSTPDDPGPVSYLLEPDGMLRRLGEITWGTRYSLVGSALSLSYDGAVITSAGLLVPVSDEAPWLGRDGSPLAAAASTATLIVGGVNTFGDAVVLVREGAGWSGYRVVGVDEAEFPSTSDRADIHNVLPYFDPRDGSARAFVITAARTLWSFAPDPATQQFGPRHSFAVEPAPGAAYALAVSNPVVLESADHRVHLIGTRSDGDLVMYYEWDFGASGVFWGFTDLTKEHFEQRDKTFTPIASGLTAFVAPWGAMHIAYLDSAGSVQVVWWAPGMTYWTADNLSQLSGAAPLHGSLTSYVTPWNGLNIAGTDAGGHLVALWWVPQFGATWMSNRYAGDAAPKLDPDSLTSFVTPWGSLNVVGLDAQTRAITVYWWTPATNQWRAEPIGVAGGASSVTTRSAPAADAPTPDGLLQIFFASGDLHIDRLFWTPGDGAAWNLEDVSAAVV